MNGTLVMINKGRGFAILLGTDGFEYFAHLYHFEDQTIFEAAKKQDQFTFEPYTDPKGRNNGLRAKNIRRAA